MKTTTRFSFIALGVTFALLPLRPFDAQAQTVATTTIATADATGDKLDRLLTDLNNASPLNDIAELTKAGVGDPVILTYVQNSTATYNVSAPDVIKLRNQGVSAEVITALIQHGTELRQPALVTTNASDANIVGVGSLYPSQPVVEGAAPVPVTYVPTPVEPANTVSVTYIGYPTDRYAPVCYPQYVTFGSRYCGTPRVACGVGYGAYRFGRYQTSVRFRR